MNTMFVEFVEMVSEFMHYKGLDINPGYVILTEGEDITAVTPGWESKGHLYVYRMQNGVWVGEWENDKLFPVDEALALLTEFNNSNLIEEIEVPEDPYTGESFDFTLYLPNDKGENDIYFKVYTPTEKLGIYKVETFSTKDEDLCSGFDGYVALSNKAAVFYYN